LQHAAFLPSLGYRRNCPTRQAVMRRRWAADPLFTAVYSVEGATALAKRGQEQARRLILAADPQVSSGRFLGHLVQPRSGSIAGAALALELNH
jgi:hypothetical protein